jgi:hypothetical protein
METRTAEWLTNPSGGIVLTVELTTNNRQVNKRQRGSTHDLTGVGSDINLRIETIPSSMMLFWIKR